MGFLVGLRAPFISPRVYDCVLENTDICFECVMISLTPSNVCFTPTKDGKSSFGVLLHIILKIRLPSIK
jgi:hypothetical protein